MIKVGSALTRTEFVHQTLDLFPNTSTTTETQPKRRGRSTRSRLTKKNLKQSLNQPVTVIIILITIIIITQSDV